ncbi:hypothetical protein COBT_000575 [Conglomerata obtusa]
MSNLIKISGVCCLFAICIVMCSSSKNNNKASQAMEQRNASKVNDNHNYNKLTTTSGNMSQTNQLELNEQYIDDLSRCADTATIEKDYENIDSKNIIIRTELLQVSGIKDPIINKSIISDDIINKFDMEPKGSKTANLNIKIDRSTEARILSTDLSAEKKVEGILVRDIDRNSDINNLKYLDENADRPYENVKKDTYGSLKINKERYKAKKPNTHDVEIHDQKITEDNRNFYSKRRNMDQEHISEQKTRQKEFALDIFEEGCTRNVNRSKINVQGDIINKKTNITNLNECMKEPYYTNLQDYNNQTHPMKFNEKGKKTTPTDPKYHYNSPSIQQIMPISSKGFEPQFLEQDHINTIFNISKVSDAATNENQEIGLHMCLHDIQESKLFENKIDRNSEKKEKISVQNIIKLNSERDFESKYVCNDNQKLKQYIGLTNEHEDINEIEGLGPDPKHNEEPIESENIVINNNTNPKSTQIINDGLIGISCQNHEVIENDQKDIKSNITPKEHKDFVLASPENTIKIDTTPDPDSFSYKSKNNSSNEINPQSKKKTSDLVQLQDVKNLTTKDSNNLIILNTSNENLCNVTAKYMRAMSLYTKDENINETTCFNDKSCTSMKNNCGQKQKELCVEIKDTALVTSINTLNSLENANSIDPSDKMITNLQEQKDNAPSALYNNKKAYNIASEDINSSNHVNNIDYSPRLEELTTSNSNIQSIKKQSNEIKADYNFSNITQKKDLDHNALSIELNSSIDKLPSHKKIYDTTNSVELNDEDHVVDVMKTIRIKHQESEINYKDERVKTSEKEVLKIDNDITTITSIQDKKPIKKFFEARTNGKYENYNSKVDQDNSFNKTNKGVREKMSKITKKITKQLKKSKKKDDEKTLLLQNFTDLNTDNCCTSKTNFDELNDDLVDTICPKPFSCKCTNKLVYFDSKVLFLLDLFDHYKKIGTPNKKFIIIHVVQGYYTKMTVELDDEQDPQYLQTVLSGVTQTSTCRYMNQFSMHLNHIVNNVTNHSELISGFQKSYNRKIILYTHDNKTNDFYKNFECNVSYSCIYIGNDTDVYMSFLIEHFYSEEQIKLHRKQNKYKYEHLLQNNK